MGVTDAEAGAQMFFYARGVDYRNGILAPPGRRPASQRYGSGQSISIGSGQRKGFWAELAFVKFD